jgi:hypothetical protein
VYNRYIRNDRGVYTRIAEEEPPHAPPPEPEDSPPPRHEHHPPAGESPGSGQGPPPFQESGDVISRTLRRLLDRFHLETVDTGDLLLLILLFLLFEEDADEELLFALGLLLIL